MCYAHISHPSRSRDILGGKGKFHEPDFQMPTDYAKEMRLHLSSGPWRGNRKCLDLFSFNSENYEIFVPLNIFLLNQILVLYYYSSLGRRGDIYSHWLTVLSINISIVSIPQLHALRRDKLRINFIKIFFLVIRVIAGNISFEKANLSPVGIWDWSKRQRGPYLVVYERRLRLSVESSSLNDLII